MGRIIENNLLDNHLDDPFPGFRPGFRPSLSGRCGQPGPSQQIVGGEEATAHSFPWMAALFVDNKVSRALVSIYLLSLLVVFLWRVPHLGGVGPDGSALRRRRGHGGVLASPLRHTPCQVRVLLGAHNIRLSSETGRTERTTMMFFTHPE
jgi:hypothetical protein